MPGSSGRRTGMVGGDAISVQEARRKTHRGRKEEGGETVRTGGVGGGDDHGSWKGRGALRKPVTLGVFGGFQASGCVGRGRVDMGRRREVLGWAEGFEPSATGTTIRRSTKLSYAHREGNPSIVTRRCRGCKSCVRCMTRR